MAARRRGGRPGHVTPPPPPLRRSPGSYAGGGAGPRAAPRGSALVAPRGPAAPAPSVPPSFSPPARSSPPHRHVPRRRGPGAGAGRPAGAEPGGGNPAGAEAQRGAHPHRRPGRLPGRHGNPAAALASPRVGRAGRWGALRGGRALAEGLLATCRACIARFRAGETGRGRRAPAVRRGSLRPRRRPGVTSGAARAQSAAGDRVSLRGLRPSCPRGERGAPGPLRGA